MKAHVHTLALCGLFALGTAQAQFDATQVKFWIGSGQDSSVLVVDFQDGSSDPSYAWGYLHDGTATGEDMLNAIAAADVNLEVGIVSGFLNDVTYTGRHAGLGGDPNYWSTWTGTGIADMAMNSGISEVLSNGEWFGCSYTDFEPALAPTEPWAAFEPFRFTAEDVAIWAGTGSHSAVLVVDFQDGEGIDSYAWGYRFDGTTTGEAMLNAIAAADPALDVTIVGGFLNDITYNGHAGLGGDPNYWSTWSGTNLGDWYMNMGVGTEVADGDLFGCSYTDFSPAIRPDYPVAASGTTSIAEAGPATLQVYPQPATDRLYLNTGDMAAAVDVFDLNGRRVFSMGRGLGLRSIDVSTWPAGMYVLRTAGSARTIAVH